MNTVLALGVESIANAGDGLFQEHLATCDKGYHLLVEAAAAGSIAFVGHGYPGEGMQLVSLIGQRLDNRL